MISITFLPVDIPGKLSITLKLSGTLLTVNNRELDLQDLIGINQRDEFDNLTNPMVDDRIQSCKEDAGNYELRIILPVNSSSTNAAKFPEEIIVSNDGPIDVPQ